jgi:hypothetical protein
MFARFDRNEHAHGMLSLDRSEFGVDALPHASIDKESLPRWSHRFRKLVPVRAQDDVIDERLIGCLGQARHSRSGFDAIEQALARGCRCQDGLFFSHRSHHWRS